jgi:hypothetical protein
VSSNSRVAKTIAIAIVLLASACAQSATPTTTLGATPQAMPLGAVDLSLKAGTYDFDFSRLDAPGKPFPKVVIRVPNGWVSYKGFAVRSLVNTPRQLVVSFWNVVDVYANSCHWLGPLIHPGSTVDELAAVLAVRPLRNATAPAVVSLGGYSGEFLEWSVPADINFSDCDQEPSDGVRYFDSWTGLMLWNAPFNPSGTTDRYQQGPGQVDRLWILDVDGRRLVIDATYMPGSTGEDRAVLQQVVDSIAFKH